MAKNTGDGGRRGQVKNRYQLLNERSNQYDKYDSDGNFMSSKASGRYKGIELRNPKKPPRG